MGTCVILILYCDKLNEKMINLNKYIGMSFILFNFFEKLTQKNHTKIHFTVDDYMIIFILCSIIFYIQIFENYFARSLVFHNN